MGVLSDSYNVFHCVLDAFVICSCCKNPDTALAEDNGLFTLRCEMVSRVNLCKYLIAAFQIRRKMRRYQSIKWHRYTDLIWVCYCAVWFSSIDQSTGSPVNNSWRYGTARATCWARFHCMIYSGFSICNFLLILIVNLYYLETRRCFLYNTD